MAGFGEKERYTDFSGGTAKAFLCEEKMDIAFHLVTPRRDCFFVSRQRKNKKRGNSKTIKSILDKPTRNQ